MLVCAKAMVRFQVWSQRVIMGAQYVPSQRTYTVMRIVGGLIVILGIFVGVSGGATRPAQEPQDGATSPSTGSMATTTTSAAGTQAASAPHTSTVSPAHPIMPAGLQNLSVGQSITTASGVTISIISVSDNRCPIGVTCVEAGTVSANVKIQRGTFTQSQIFTLGVPTTEYGFTAELIGASPAKIKGQSIPQSAYSLAFTIK